MSDIFQYSDKTMEVKTYKEDKSIFHERSQTLKNTLTGNNRIN